MPKAAVKYSFPFQNLLNFAGYAPHLEQREKRGADIFSKNLYDSHRVKNYF